ncbi:MAG: AIM24 family protein, partial [Acidobacteriota bacterium]|nr:AIM24 family protein [Acidobacteriota bacterium]
MTVTHKVAGELAQSVTCQLDQDQAVFAEAGTFRWKTTNVSIETRLISPKGAAQAAQKGGGLLGAA